MFGFYRGERVQGNAARARALAEDLAFAHRSEIRVRSPVVLSPSSEGGSLLGIDYNPLYHPSKPTLGKQWVLKEDEVGDRHFEKTLDPNMDNLFGMNQGLLLTDYLSSQFMTLGDQGIFLPYEHNIGEHVASFFTLRCDLIDSLQEDRSVPLSSQLEAAAKEHQIWKQACDFPTDLHLSGNLHYSWKTDALPDVPVVDYSFSLILLDRKIHVDLKDAFVIPHPEIEAETFNAFPYDNMDQSVNLEEPFATIRSLTFADDERTQVKLVESCEGKGHLQAEVVGLSYIPGFQEPSAPAKTLRLIESAALWFREHDQRVVDLERVVGGVQM